MKDLNIVNESSQTLEPTIKAMFKDIWTGLGNALAAMPRWEKGFHIFWLLGPFILLIERSPADIWLSILALAFVVRSTIKRDGGWLKVFWVRASFLFLAVCMVLQKTLLKGFGVLSDILFSPNGIQKRPIQLPL